MRDKNENFRFEEIDTGRLSNLLNEFIEKNNDVNELVKNIWNSDLADEEVIALLIAIGMIIDAEYPEMVNVE